MTQKAAKAVKQGRRQRVKPVTIAKLGTKLTKSVLDGTKLTDTKFRNELSVAPLGARLAVFRDVAKSKGLKVQTFSRRLRGMLKNGKTNRVTKSHKTFFEVLPETMELFRESMGENVIWFAASASPGHLHTLVADQAGGPTMTHNTYGAQMDAASVSRLQYLAPAQLNKAQMSRFTRYLNAGVEAGQGGKGEVYGFKNSRGEWVYQTACTNWATSAPVGDLKRWAKIVDTKIINASKSGSLGVEFKDGLHAALAKATDAPARQALLAKALKTPGLSKHSQASAKRLVKEFDVILEKFPKRPADLVGRQTLSEMMGVSRSQDPAKWMYDLMLSKSVPLVGVMASTSQTNFKKMEFDMEIMGTFNAKGDVVKGAGYQRQGLGVIPPERGGAPVEN
tara:strand:- start:61115 stop:62293 length:1179 start_codon:yes stop_codon:yes gene_type:complete